MINIIASHTFQTTKTKIIAIGLGFLAGTSALTCHSFAMDPNVVEDKEPVYLKVHPNSPSFMLPDGSKVAYDGAINFWVQEPGCGHPAMLWKDYAQKKGLNMQIIIDSGSEEKSPELRIVRGSNAIKFPDGSEVAPNGGDEVWVKTPGQSYFATPWKTYETQTNITINPILVSRPKTLVSLKITRSSPLFIFKLPDGSEVHTNSENKVWVKTPQQGYPATRWEDYIYSRKLNIWPEVTIGNSDTAQLCLMRGSIPFQLPGGYEVATNSSNEVWVKAPGQGYYATPWVDFVKATGFIPTPVIVNETYSVPLPFYAPRNAFIKEAYKGVFEVTQQACDHGYETFSGKIVTPADLAVEALKTGSKKYQHSALATIPIVTNKYKTVIRVINEDSFIAGQEMISRGLNPSVANAANKDTPGGGAAGGAQAQEEELCKRATVYKGLLPELYPMKDDELIYNPGVSVFMHPSTYSFMKEPFKVAVITQAYISLYERFTDLNEPEKSPEYQKITRDKIEAHLRLSAAQGHDSAVLAAAGCGAFSKGRPGPVSRVVAPLFREVIEQKFPGVFKEITFGILVSDPNSTLLKSFKKEFGVH